MKGRIWSENEMQTVQDMRAEGHSWNEIGVAIGRTGDAVKCACSRPRAETGCLSKEDFDKDAVIGSQRLLHALLAMAA